MDKIILKNIRLRGIIGVYDWERALPQEMVISITLFTDTRQAGISDRLADCVDYDSLAQQVRAHAQKAARQTIEALAEDVARICLKEAGVKKVIVYVEKPGAVTFAESAGVEIERP
jgi:FolB domain-containing protein